MERETSEYKLHGVSAAQFKVLRASGSYTDKHGCLTRQMADGRLEIVMTHDEIETMERLEREVEDECNNVDESLPSIPINEPTQIAPLPHPPQSDIPQADKDIWSKLGMDKPPVPKGENN
jgi:hypothetical protein